MSLEKVLLGVPQVISLPAFWKGRDIQYSSELSDEITRNATDLIVRVNSLLYYLDVKSATVSSGWRPKVVNENIGGAPNSLHLTGKAIDILDPANKLSKKLLEAPGLLKDHGLWMEDKAHTRTWVHLDTGERPEREVRIFKP